MAILLRVIKAVLLSVATALIIVSGLFFIFSNFHIQSDPDQDILGNYIIEEGGVIPACADYLLKYITLQNFEFNITSYRAGHGIFAAHLVSTIKMVVSTLMVILLSVLLLAGYRVKRNKKKNIIGSFISSLSTIHTLIFLALTTLFLKIVDLPFWGYILIIAISNNIFKEFYSDLNNELDRILGEKYVQRAVAWGNSRLSYALPDIIITFSRSISSKFPLLLSSTFIIEYFSPNNSGLALDLLNGVANHDYFLVLSVTGVLVFTTTIIYNLGQFPTVLDPRHSK